VSFFSQNVLWKRNWTCWAPDANATLLISYDAINLKWFYRNHGITPPFSLALCLCLDFELFNIRLNLKIFIQHETQARFLFAFQQLVWPRKEIWRFIKYVIFSRTTRAATGRNTCGRPLLRLPAWWGRGDIQTQLDNGGAQQNDWNVTMRYCTWSTSGKPSPDVCDAFVVAGTTIDVCWWRDDDQRLLVTWRSISSLDD